MSLTNGTAVSFNVKVEYAGRVLSHYVGTGVVERTGDFPILGETYQVRVVTAETPDAEKALGGCLEAKRSSLRLI